MGQKTVYLPTLIPLKATVNIDTVRPMGIRHGKGSLSTSGWDTLRFGALLALLCRATDDEVASHPKSDGREVACDMGASWGPCHLQKSSPRSRVAFSPRWWQLKDFWFSLLFGEMNQFDWYFSDGLKPPTRKVTYISIHIFLLDIFMIHDARDLGCVFHFIRIHFWEMCDIRIFVTHCWWFRNPIPNHLLDVLESL